MTHLGEDILSPIHFFVSKRSGYSDVSLIQDSGIFTLEGGGLPPPGPQEGEGDTPPLEKKKVGGRPPAEAIHGGEGTPLPHLPHDSKRQD